MVSNRHRALPYTSYPAEAATYAADWCNCRKPYSSHYTRSISRLNRHFCHHSLILSDRVSCFAPEPHCRGDKIAFFMSLSCRRVCDRHIVSTVSCIRASPPPIFLWLPKREGQAVKPGLGWTTIAKGNLFWKIFQCDVLDAQVAVNDAVRL